MLKLLTEEYHTKSRLVQLAIVVGFILTFASLLLILQSAFASIDIETEGEGKRYVNPDGGAPLYEDELTEDEKDYYEEYKPEKEEKQIEDWRNTVSNDDENEITPEAESYVANTSDEKEQHEEEVADKNEQAKSSDNVETQEANEQVEEQDEPEKEEDDNSDSESEE